MTSNTLGNFLQLDNLQHLQKKSSNLTNLKVNSAKESQFDEYFQFDTTEIFYFVYNLLLQKQRRIPDSFEFYNSEPIAYR